MHLKLLVVISAEPNTPIHSHEYHLKNTEQNANIKLTNLHIYIFKHSTQEYIHVYFPEELEGHFQSSLKNKKRHASGTGRPIYLLISEQEQVINLKKG